MGELGANDSRLGMRWVPGGTFRMGADLSYPEEAPVHMVTVSGFWMDEYTVGYSMTLGAKGYVRGDVINRKWGDFYVVTRTIATGKARDPNGTLLAIMQPGWPVLLALIVTAVTLVCFRPPRGRTAQIVLLAYAAFCLGLMLPLGEQSFHVDMSERHLSEHHGLLGFVQYRVSLVLPQAEVVSVLLCRATSD